MVKKPEKKPAKGKSPSPAPASRPPAGQSGGNTATADAGKADTTAAAKSAEPWAQPTPPEKEKGAAGVLWMLALLAIVIGGGYATLPLWKAYVPGLAGLPGTAPARLATAEPQINDAARGDETSGDIERERDTLNAKLGAMIDRVGSLEQQLAEVRKMVNATALPDEVANANKSLQQLSGRLTKIEESNEAVGTMLNRLNRLEQDLSDAVRTAAAPPPGVTVAIGEIAKRLEDLESGSNAGARQSAQRSNAQALVLAVGQLRQTLTTGAPYAPALQTVLRIGGDDGQLIQAAGDLQAHAETGVPSLQTLTREYKALAGDLTATLPDATAGFFEQTLARLKSLVRISRIEEAEEGSVSADGLADKAGMALRQGDLATAIGILQELKEPSARVREWTRRAESRLAAERALALLNVYAVSLLAPATE